MGQHVLPLDVSRKYLREIGSHRLEDVARYLRLAESEDHRGLSDARLAMAVFQTIAGRAKRLNTVDDLFRVPPPLHFTDSGSFVVGHQQATKTWVACPVSLSGVRVLLLLCSPIVRIRCPARSLALSQPHWIGKGHFFQADGARHGLSLVRVAYHVPPSGRAAGEGACAGIRPGSSGDWQQCPGPGQTNLAPMRLPPSRKNHPRILSKPGTERKSVRAAVGAPPSNWGKCFSGIIWFDTRHFSVRFPFSLPRRGQTYQPRATPWVRSGRKSVALKGRNNTADRGIPAAIVLALSGLEEPNWFSHPGRCPRLICCAPSGRKTGSIVTYGVIAGYA